MEKLTEAQWARISSLAKDLVAMDPSQRKAAWRDVRNQGKDSPLVLACVKARLLAQTGSDMDGSSGKTTVAEPYRAGAPPADLSGLRCGSYILGEPIGRGCMGSVYAGKLAGAYGGEYDLAVKVMRAEQFEEPELMEQLFQEEFAIHAGLRYKNIPHMYTGDICDDPDGHGQLLYFATQYVRGIPIDQFVAEQGLLPSEVLALFQPICTAIDKAHRAMVLHCDLKPAHILVETDPDEQSVEPYIIDFGMALVNDPVLKLRNKGFTRQYASPEQLDEERYGRPTPATDVYSLGVILYELLAGQHPFHAALGRPPEELSYIMLHYPPEPLCTYCELCTEDLQEAVAKALELDPDKRYRSVGSFLSAINLCIDGVRAREAEAAREEQAAQEMFAVPRLALSQEDRDLIAEMLRAQDFWQLPSDRIEFARQAFFGHEKAAAIVHQLILLCHIASFTWWA